MNEFVHEILDALHQFRHQTAVGPGGKLKIVVFGSTGGTGRQLVQQTLQQGHEVTAFVRDPGKIKLSHENLRVARGNVLDFDSVKGELQGQDAVLSALGVRPPVWVVILVAIACQLVARFAGLSGSLNLLVRLGVPLVVLFLSQRKITTLSMGTKNILQGMEELRVRRFICESSLGVGDSRDNWGPLPTTSLFPCFCGTFLQTKKSKRKP